MKLTKQTVKRQKRRYVLFIFLAIWGMQTMLAQSFTINTQSIVSETASQKGEPRRITGTITGSNGESIIGANIFEKGLNNGVITDI
ncbi:hypothetical protein EZS27_033682 [termite gut metagenome]|uniref:TonB-dependent receptor SusC n=1 Tax=termite gut metagenome TaxID=433724 RepID=A0A5J4Q2N5_9ZZZZ